jgi:hypothetical protein
MENKPAQTFEIWVWEEATDTVSLLSLHYKTKDQCSDAYSETAQGHAKHCIVLWDGNKWVLSCLIREIKVWGYVEEARDGKLWCWLISFWCFEGLYHLHVRGSSSRGLIDWLPLKMKATWSFRTSGTAYPVTQTFQMTWIIISTSVRTSDLAWRRSVWSFFPACLCILQWDTSQLQTRTGSQYSDEALVWMTVEWWFHCLQGCEISLFFKLSRLVLGCTHPCM